MMYNMRAIAEDQAAPAPMERDFERSLFSILSRVRKARVTPIIKDRVARKITTNVMARLTLMILDRGRISEAAMTWRCAYGNPWFKVEGLYFA